MGCRLVLMPKRTFDSEKLVFVVRVTAMLSIESRSWRSSADSSASSSSMSVSNGLYFGRVSSFVTL